MKIELFLDEGEEYPQLFSVWRVDQDTGRADLTTRKNYVDDRDGWDQWRKTDDENIRLKAENGKLRDALKALMMGTNAELCADRDELGCNECFMHHGKDGCTMIDAMKLLGIDMFGEPLGVKS